MNGIVIDENVIVEATAGKKPDGTPAGAEAEFMYRLFRSSDTVFANAAIVDKFRGIQDKLDSGRHPYDYNHKIYKTLTAMPTDGSRTTRVEGIKVGRKGLKKCDKEFVGVAIQSGSVVVTSDMPLRGIIEDMRSEGSPIRCVTAEALDLLDAAGKEEVGG